MGYERMGSSGFGEVVMGVAGVRGSGDRLLGASNGGEKKREAGGVRSAPGAPRRVQGPAVRGPSPRSPAPCAWVLRSHFRRDPGSRKESGCLSGGTPAVGSVCVRGFRRESAL